MRVAVGVAVWITVGVGEGVAVGVSDGAGVGGATLHADSRATAIRHNDPMPARQRTAAFRLPWSFRKRVAMPLKLFVRCSLRGISRNRWSGWPGDGSTPSGPLSVHSSAYTDRPV